jgi:hypothetical protein
VSGNIAVGQQKTLTRRLSETLGKPGVLQAGGVNIKNREAKPSDTDCSNTTQNPAGFAHASRWLLS